MALQPCRECGREVSTEADTCPSCGTPAPTLAPGTRAPQPGGHHLASGWLILLLGFLLGLTSFEFFGGLVGVASFVLAIIAITKGRTAAGVVLLVASLVVVGFLWLMAITPAY